MTPETVDVTGDRTLEERQRTRRFFNRVAPAFHVIDRRLRPEYRKALEQLNLPSEWTVLDVGTGTGTLATVFSERGHPVTGIDTAERLLKKARKRVPGGEFRLLDLIDLKNLEANSFDIVALAYVLHGLSPELRTTALGEAARLGRQGVFVIDYSARGSWIVRLIEWIEGPHYPSFVSAPVASLLLRNGLRVVSEGMTSSYGGWWLAKTQNETDEQIE